MDLLQFPSRPDCKACELHALDARSVGVPSSWVQGTLPTGPNTTAVIMLGQNPGLQEDLSNQPFVGPSGQLVRSAYIPPSIRTLASFYLFNTARCYTHPSTPPKNRHYNACMPHSLVDLKEVHRCHSTPSTTTTMVQGYPFPLVSCASSSSASSNCRIAVMALGAPAASTLLKTLQGKGLSLSEALKIQGHEFQVPNTDISIHFFVTYHPAFILRKPPAIHAVKDHIALLASWLEGTISTPSKPHIIKAGPPCPPAAK